MTDVVPVEATPTGEPAGGDRVRMVDVPDAHPKYEIVGYAEIPVDLIERHPHNPRPAFHLSDDDPELQKLGDAIKTQGQTSPALVYEIIEDGQPTGRYRLYQGERRWRSCKIAGVPTLRCFIAASPTSEAEEWDWLGVEEAFKQPWQAFFVLRYAHNLAAKHGVSMYSSEISAKTGVPMSDLRVGEKVFALELPIQAMVAEYEELMYGQLTGGQRRRGTRLNGSGIRSKEFPVNKAALVWDIFEAMRANVPLLVKKYSDLELQTLIARKVTQGATVEDLQRLHGQIRQAGKNPPPGLLTEVAELLDNDKRNVRQFVRNTGAAETGRLNKFMARAPKVRELAAQIANVADQIGTDPDDLEIVDQECLELIRDVSEMQRAISRRIRELQRTSL